MEGFPKVFEVFVLLVNLAILGFLAYVWVRIIKRRDIFTRVGRVKGLFALAFLLLMTIFFVMTLALPYWL